MSEQVACLRMKRRHARHRLTATMVLTLLGTPLVGNAARVPTHFEASATSDLDGGLRCVAGLVSKDGYNQRAYVYLEDAGTHEPRWVTRIPVLTHFYQNRASHCLVAGNKVYALIQSDSDSVPVISQTLVNIVAFDRATGQIASTRFVKLPDVKGAITEFVYEGPESFRLDGGKLVVKGEYGFKGDAADTRTPFMDSVPVEEAE